MPWRQQCLVVVVVSAVASTSTPASAIVSLVLELRRTAVLVGVVLVGALVLDVMLVVHALGRLLGLMVGSLTVVGVHA